MTTGVFMNGIEKEQIRRDKIQRCFRSDEAKFLVEKLLELHQQYSTQLKSSREPVDIYRHQGRIDVLELILRMREER